VLILAGQLAQTASVLTKSLRGLLASVEAAAGNSAVRTYDSRLPAQAGSGRGWDFRQAQYTERAGRTDNGNPG